MRQATEFKRLSFAFNVTPENERGERGVADRVWLTTPWYSHIIMTDQFLRGADERYAKLTRNEHDPYHALLHIVVDNGEARYRMTFDSLVGVWTGVLLSGQGGA